MGKSATEKFHDTLGRAWDAAGGNIVHDHSAAAQKAAFLAGVQAHADGWGPEAPDVWCVFTDESLRSNYRDGWREADADMAQYAAGGFEERD